MLKEAIYVDLFGGTNKKRLHLHTGAGDLGPHITFGAWMQAHWMHRWRYQVSKSPWSQMHYLLQLVTKCLQLEKLTGPQVMEQVVVDHYLWALPKKLQSWVSYGEPQAMDCLVEMVDHLSVMGDLLGPAKPRGPLPVRGVKPPTNLGVSTQESKGATTPACQSSTLAYRNKNMLYWQCHSRCHIQDHCPLHKEPMECESVQRMSYYAQRVCAVHLNQTKGQYECDIWVNQLHARVLLDTRSMVTVVGS